MITISCDCCLVVITKSSNTNTFSIPCPLIDKKGEARYVDSNGNPVSERVNTFDLCNSCMNRVYTAAQNIIRNVEEK